ncbi:MAG: hypothetical protein NWE98_00990 [Candidatus Bathyarchaeota archaeon]|nr:hypothetical protein [Candidatus Bathyarchaeota archaeon]
MLNQSLLCQAYSHMSLRQVWGKQCLEESEKMQRALDAKHKNKKQRRLPPLTLQNPTPSESGRLFEIVFVCNDDEQSVGVVESSFIDFNMVIEQLEKGNSVFIAPKICRKPPVKKTKQWNMDFITHV